MAISTVAYIMNNYFILFYFNPLYTILQTNKKSVNLLFVFRASSLFVTERKENEEDHR